MPDPNETPNKADQQSVSPPEPTPTEPVAEVVDDRGVPLKNRIAELERKLTDAATREEQYQQALGRFLAGQQAAQQVPPKPADDVVGLFDEQSRKFVEAIVRPLIQQEAYQLLTRAQAAQEATDPEIQREAQQEFTAMNANPYYATWTQDQRELLAIERAKNKVLAKRQQAGQQQQGQQLLREAADAQAQGASLPGTGPAGQERVGQDKEAFIKKFINDPEQHRLLKGMWKIDPASADGQKRLREVAEAAWKGSAVGSGFVQQPVEIMSGGAR